MPEGKASSPSEKRDEKQESSRSRQTRDKHYIFVELKREKAFPLGGKNYKHKKLNREKVSALPTKEGHKKTKNKCG